MTTTGGTSGTPVSGSGGIGTGNTVSPLPLTFLSLSRYARILGLNPAHFHRAYAPNLSPAVYPITGCSSVWPRYNWQNHDQVSHEELAYAIQSAEEDLIAYMKYFPAPAWVQQELIQYPRSYDRSIFWNGTDIRGLAKQVDTKYQRVIAPGRRATTFLVSATTAGGSLEYLDEDSDGFYETAQITFATALTNISEIKAYISGSGATQEWEIRPAKQKYLSVGNAVLRFDSWLFIKPELLAMPPTSDPFRAIDISNTNNFVGDVEIYREYNDMTAVASTFYWQGLTSTTLDGTLLMTSPNVGQLTAIPASYDAVLEKWVSLVCSLPTVCTDGTEPDIVNVWYYSGDRSTEHQNHYSTDPMPDWWSECIAWVATARLTRPLCGCGNAKDLADHLAEDLSLSQSGRAYMSPLQILNNPLGTRRGEVMAWRRISKLVRNRGASYALI